MGALAIDLLSAGLGSALFVPADRPDRYPGAFAAGADAVFVDLEDAVAVADKDEARLTLVASDARSLGGEETAFLVRINPPATDFGRADLEAIAAIAPDGIVVPKADPASIEAAAAARVPLIPLVETAAGVLAAAELAAHPAVAQLMFGPVDLALDIGATESPGGDELDVARSGLVLAAAAAGGPRPLDGPCIFPRDPEALAVEIGRAKRLGFGGKACVHPVQVGPVNAAFTPSSEEVAWAERVISSYESAGSGVLVVDGEMIDLPVVQIAQNTLRRVRKHDS